MTTVLDEQEKMDAKTAHCAVCGRNLPLRQMHEIHELRPALQAMIAEQVGDIDDQSLICERDLSRYRRLYVEKLLNDERGELSELDRRVLDSFVTGGSTVQSSADLVLEPPRSFGERAADAVASFGGSWSFILLFCAVLLLWMSVNISGLFAEPFDPYPFILLNLAFSTQAAYAAPLILLAQNRQENRDRVSLEEDRRRAEQTKADTEYLARELAALRLAVGEVVTRDYMRRELEDLRDMLVELVPPKPKKNKGKRAPADSAEPDGSDESEQDQ